jgi:signal transduction histidine kinase
MVRGIVLSQTKKPKLFYKLILLTGSMGAIFIMLFWLVVVISEDQLELISLHHWLESEAAMFEQDYKFYGHRDSVPNHYEFDIYFSDSYRPNWLKSYTTPGFYEHHLGPEDKHFLVRPDPSGAGLFYVVFKDDADDYLDEYESKLHLFTLSLGVLIIVLTFIYGLYQVRQIALPLQKVLGKIRLMPPDQPDFSVEAHYQELAIIEQALANSKSRIANYFRREQEFSRFAAHEIRTPLMVLQGSAEILSQLQSEHPLTQKASQRISQACADISLLTDTFLLLGKEHIDSHHYQTLALDQLVIQQLATTQKLFGNSNLHCNLQISAAVEVSAPNSFVIVLLNNLLKNAFSYAATELSIALQPDSLVIRNDISADAEGSGYGYGLVIIERICDRLHWQFSTGKTATEFRVMIGFQPTASQAEAANTNLTD